MAKYKVLFNDELEDYRMKHICVARFVGYKPMGWTMWRVTIIRIIVLDAINVVGIGRNGTLI